jgi:hypothetical protein
MKASIDLPDDLYRRLKVKSALEGRPVGEVANALFSAWVDGRLTNVLPDRSERDSKSLPEQAPDRELWLAQWRAVSADISAATERGDSLVDQLYRDRR